MEKFHERIKQRMAELGINQTELAKLVGVKQPSINALLAGDIARPRFIVELATALKTTTEWLTTNKSSKEAAHQSIHRFQPEGESFHLNSAIIGDSKESILSFGPNDVPIYGSASGSTDSVILNFDQILGYAMRHPNQQGLKNGFALYARGSSMSPRYEPGELVYVVANKPPQRDADCIIELNNGEGFIKIFVKQTAKEVICRQLNPAREWRRSISDIKALHAVVGRG